VVTLTLFITWLLMVMLTSILLIRYAIIIYRADVVCTHMCLGLCIDVVHSYVVVRTF